ncbi:type II restriction endonuclease [Streptomyces parvulus]
MDLVTSASSATEEWLRGVCDRYAFDVRGVLRTDSPQSSWPLTASSPEELEQKLHSGGHLLPLPKEPASLANVIEVSLVDFIIASIEEVEGISYTRGTERGYPDLELSGPAFGGGHHAIDIKTARRGFTQNGKPTGRTNSRITLYTGNTYFKYPHLKWPGTFRPFNEYKTHLDVLVIYTLNEQAAWRVDDLEIIVQEPWRIASKRRSSTTREYIGAVENIEDLRAGAGEFPDADSFYKYWRAFQFKVSAQVSKQLDRLVAQQTEELARLREAAAAGDDGNASV